MLKKLKRSFFILSTALTGLVLLVACIFAYSYSKSQVESAHQLAFEYQCQSLSVLLAGTNRIDHNKIQRMEKDGNLFIYFYDHGQLLPIASAETADFRDGLISQAQATMKRAETDTILSTEVRYSEPVNYNFDSEYAGQGYMGKFISVPTSQQGWYSFIVLKSTEPMHKELSALQIRFVLIFTGGVVILFLISWGLAKRSVRPVEVAQQKQTEFIAAASHELKSPLALTASSLDMMASDRDNADEYIELIRAENSRMSHLVEDLLILAGSGTGKWTVRKAAVSMEEVLSSVYEMVLPAAEQNQKTLELFLPDAPLPVVYADEERIFQILEILLSNAISYAPNNTSIELKATVHTHNIELAVIDHGAGIPKGDREKIFDSFYRRQEDHSDKSHFGLGLAVAKELVQLHGGTIGVTDTPGGGATFTVTLPKANERA